MTKTILTVFLRHGVYQFSSVLSLSTSLKTEGT